MQAKLVQLYTACFGEKPSSVVEIGAHASQRQIYRLIGDKLSAIGIFNPSERENRAFIEFSRHFKRHALPVPEIYGEDLSQGIYLEEDLGDVTLRDLLKQKRSAASPFPTEIESYYHQALKFLTAFQIGAGQQIDFSLCHPVKVYDYRSMLWDMHYFRDKFLKQVNDSFDYDQLDKDFLRFAKNLAAADHNFFLYRDFQSRNIMVREGQLFFIDYQSGRRGALQFDVASLLYQSSADIPDEARERLLETYIKELEKGGYKERALFMQYYYGFVLLRMMQVLGTYGEQGLRQGKKYFIDSIPFALRNLKALLNRGCLPAGFDVMSEAFWSVIRLFEEGKLVLE